jgi:hypothetical protein
MRRLLPLCALLLATSPLLAGGFTFGPNLSVPRELHTATPFAGGKVLIAGGEAGRNTAYTSTEVYNAATGGFEGSGAMTTPRFQHTATLLDDGRVLIAGGQATWGGAATSTAELFDPNTRTFTATGSMHVARSQHIAQKLLDGRVLVAGGDGGTSAEIYDPTTGQFTDTAPAPSHHLAGSATLGGDGRVYVVGNGLSSGTLDVYSGGNWTTATSAGDSRLVTLPDGNILIAGGAAHINGPNGKGSVSAVLAITSNPPFYTSLQEYRTGHTATLLADGTVLIACGNDGVATAGGYASAWGFTPYSVYYRVPDMNLGRAYATATLLTNGQVLIAGGESSSGTTNTTELFTPLQAPVVAITSSKNPSVAGEPVTITGSIAPGPPNPPHLFLTSGSQVLTDAPQTTYAFPNEGTYIIGAHYYGDGVNWRSGAAYITQTVTAGAPACTPPVVTTQPQTTSADIGGTATFTVDYSGTPGTIQWYEGLPNENAPTPIAGANGKTFVTPPITGFTRFFARITNDCGTVNSNAALVLISTPSCTAPAITADLPLITNVIGGSSATLTIEYSGTAGTVQWYQGARPDTSTPIAGAVSTSYVTPRITGPMLFWARVTNACGTADSSTATVTTTTVCSEPSITRQPVGRTVFNGETATLFVGYFGLGVSLQWYEGATGVTTFAVPGAASATYTTPPLHVGTSFWVRVTTPCGVADSDAAQLLVTARRRAVR